MEKNFLKILVCPKCKSELSLKIQLVDKEEVISGFLLCSNCKRVYPIINSIPRMLLDEFIVDERQRKTQKSFGYQWIQFSEMVIDFKENFLNYIYPVKEDFFKGKLGLDAGCGFGRHIFNAANFGAEMVGMDISKAIDSSYKNTRHLPNIHLVQGDIYNPPFRESTFDFVYSIGVLHHLPAPENGFKSLVSLVKEHGSIFIWVYSNRRKFINLLLEAVRNIAHRLPHGLLKYICFVISIVDYSLFIFPYKIMSKIPLFNKFIRKIYFQRIVLYAKYPFQVCFADWFDRLAPPIRYYYDDKDMKIWLDEVQLRNQAISPTGLYGWRAYGEKR